MAKREKFHITEAEKQRRLNDLKNDKCIRFADKNKVIQISLQHMPRPKGKIYID